MKNALLFLVMVVALLVIPACATQNKAELPPPGIISMTTLQSTSIPESAMPTSIKSTDKSVLPSPTPQPPSGEIQQAKFNSVILGRDYHYFIYLPAGYGAGNMRYPVFYLLHGRGDNMSAWAVIAKDLNRLIASGELPPCVAVMPDFPSSNKASYYIDSAYTGKNYPAEQVESAFFKELIPEIDMRYLTIPDRQSRVVAGYSMGGYGAMRYLLAHPDFFIGAIVLSPAVYTPLPPAGSSTREFGAFGKGENLFDNLIYQSKNYPTLLAGFSAAKLKSYLFIASGDDEYANPLTSEAMNDIDVEAHLLYNRARRVDYLTSELRIVDGTHSWDVWRPTFIEGARFLAKFLVVEK